MLTHARTHLSLQRTCRFGVMCAEQVACVRRQSWAGHTIDMFEFEFPIGTWARLGAIDMQGVMFENATPVLNASSAVVPNRWVFVSLRSQIRGAQKPLLR
jgi:hypothetical protein